MTYGSLPLKKIEIIKNVIMNLGGDHHSAMDDGQENVLCAKFLVKVCKKGSSVGMGK